MIKKFLYFFAIISILSACKKETVSHIGNDILPDSDKFIVNSYTFNIKDAITVKGKAFVSNNRNTAMLGSYLLDNEFGMVKADFITQVELSTTNISLSDTFAIDSVKLFLRLYEDEGTDEDIYYGDNSSSLNFKIHELKEEIFYDSTYYSNFNAEAIIETNTICETSFVPNIDDKLLIFNLDTNYARKIFNNHVDNMSNDEFVKVVKGLYITTDSVTSGGSVLYTNLDARSSKITIYYRAVINGEIDTTDLDLEMKSTAEISMFKHTYGNIIFDEVGDYVYSQGLGGAMGKIDLARVKIFADTNNLVINKAELIIPNTNDPIYGSPNSLHFEIVDSLNSGLVTKGNINNDKTEYSVIITNYISDIINNTQANTSLFIYPAYPTRNPTKTKLSNNLNNNNIKLKLTYTKY